jgi:hypothetical protein
MLPSRGPTDSHATRLYHNETTSQGLSSLCDEVDNIASDLPLQCDGVSEVDHTPCRLAVGINQLTEIPILREHNACFAGGKRDNLSVCRPWREFRNRANIMAGGSEGTNDPVVAAFIRQKAHGLLPGGSLARPEEDRLFMGDRVSGIPDGGLDVFTGQPRIGGQQIGRSCPLAELTEDQFDRDSGPTDDWFPHHDLGIHLDSICDRHRESLLVVSRELAMRSPSSLVGHS